MPHSGQKPYDGNIEQVAQDSLPVSAERDVHIIAEPCGQRNMPAPPEVRHGDCGQRVIKVLIIMKAEHVPHADRHIAVSAEVKIELQGKAERAEPGCRDTRIRSAQGADLLPQGTGLIGDQHFLEQARHEAQDTLLKSLQRESPVMQLFLNIGKAHDRAGHQLREHGHIGEIGRVAVFRFYLAAVQVDDITHRLEGIKTDADGKMDPGLRKLRAEQTVYGQDGKVCILEKSKYGQVDADTAAQKKSPPEPGRAKAFHQPSICVVERGRKKHQQNVQRFSPRVKNKAENKQNPIFP